MSRRKRHEEHVNHEAWAIPYGDLLTLLLAFFVVMYSMSTVNEGKYRVLGETLNAEFRGKPTTISPVQVGDQPLGTHAEKDVIVVPPSVRNIGTKPTSEQASNPDHPTITDTVVKPDPSLDQVADNVADAMSNLIHDKLVTIQRHDLWVEVQIQTDILFPSGSATLSPLAISVLEPLADSLRSFKNTIRVEGHTDNMPIKTLEFPSNWELSAARAATVVHLFSSRGVEASRLTVIGYGEYRPSVANNSVEARNINRRVVLVILNVDKGVDQKATQ